MNYWAFFLLMLLGIFCIFAGLLLFAVGHTAAVTGWVFLATGTLLTFAYVVGR